MRHIIFAVTNYTKTVFITSRVAVYMLAMPILLLSARPQDPQAKSSYLLLTLKECHTHISAAQMLAPVFIHVKFWFI